MTTPESRMNSNNYRHDASSLPFNAPAYHKIPEYNLASLKTELIGLHNETVVPDAPPPINRIENVPEAVRNNPKLLAMLGFGEPTPPDPLTDFDADKNALHSGVDDVIWASHRFPHAADKLQLLEYAIAKAQACEDPADGALLLSTAVLATHPFEDGNGRVSRALYSDLMGTERPDEANRTGNTGDARKQIDLGSVFSSQEMKEIVNDYTYSQRDMEYDASLEVRLLSEEVDLPKLLEGLSKEEKSDLTDALGFDDISTVDRPGLLFSSSLLTKNKPSLAGFVEKDQVTESGLLSIQPLLSVLTPAERRQFVAGLWDYRKLQAQAVIDFLSDDYGGEKTMSRPSGGLIKLRDVVLEKTTNLVTSNMPQ